MGRGSKAELLLNRMASDLTKLEDRVALLEGSPLPPEPEPIPPKPQPTTKYAPRAYNTTPSADARFCMSSQYGVIRDGNGFVDAQGVRYDESGRDLGGRTGLQVPQLKGANSMDGREPCDQYTGPMGTTIGGSAGYPAASFER